MKQIYLDNASTTQMDKLVLKEMNRFFRESYGNASSVHDMGEEAKKALEKSREIIAKKINAKSEEIYFTSGGSESNNLALKGLFFENYPIKNHIITTKIEHESVLKTCKWLESRGAKITYLDVDGEGFVSIDDLKKAISKKTILVSIIHANNEIGTIQNIEKIGEICEEKNVLFHTDACQSFTKVPIDVKKQKIDLMTLNSHKIHGPKGIGALYIKNEIKISPLIHGGGQEKNLRSGTENTASIVGFGKAVEISKEKDIEKMGKLRNKIIQKSIEIKGVSVNGPISEISIEKRLCNNVNLFFEKIEGEVIGEYLNNKGIFVSVGSACKSNSDLDSNRTSHVIEALGIKKEKAGNTIRVSISKYTTEEEINFFLKELKNIVEKHFGRFSK